MDTLQTILLAFWATMAAMAPWLLLGFAAAGVLSIFFSPRFVERHLGGRGLASVMKASVLGVPLPLCSCGVIPVGAGLYRHGASRGATSSFMLSTPQTGVDSILATYALMGPVFAVVRPMVALVNGLLGGLLIDAADRTKAIQKPMAEAKCDSSSGTVCDSTSAEPIKTPTKWSQALRYGLITLPADIVGALLVGLVVAALLTALVPADALAPYLGGGVLAMGAAVLIGAPIYVCATASIPIGMGLLAAGASPGAVLAFLIAGPATNAATISVTWDVLGRRTGLLYLLSVVVTAVGAGQLLDTLFTVEALRLPLVAGAAHHHGISALDHIWAGLMLALLLPAVWNRYRPARREGETAAQTDKVTLTITGMNCSRCVEAVERGLREVVGVSDARIDLKTGQALIQGNTLDDQRLKEAVHGLGYGVAD
ncbi:MAG: SO_0444 family Cu/Zn efflux transporter [Planctomycetota bacterium]